jgi:peptidoglycan/xylan/chitin deacetylase (PgdA/CDA1 family)
MTGTLSDPISDSRRRRSYKDQSPASRRFEPLVLCYHATSDRWEHHLSVAPRVVARQVRWLLTRRYRAVRAADVVPGRGRLLHVTFDDAFRSLVATLPLLEQLGVPVTVFVCTALADGGRPFAPSKRYGSPTYADLETLDWDALRSLADRGVEIGSHTVSHPHLTRIGDSELERELRDSRECIETELQRPCRFLAYPDGDNDQRVRAAVRDAGYDAAFALPGRSRPYDPLAIPRVGVWRKDHMTRFTLKTSAIRQPIGAARRWR